MGQNHLQVFVKIASRDFDNWQKIVEGLIIFVRVYLTSSSMAESSNSHLLMINKQLRHTLNSMKESLKVVESSQAQKMGNYKSNEIKNIPPNSNLNFNLVLEHDKLTADIFVKEQEINALKSQLIAAQTSHKEAENLWKHITAENNNLRNTIRNFERQFNDQAQEIAEIKSERDKLLKLLSKMLLVHNKSTNTIDDVQNEIESLKQKLSKSKNTPLIIGDEFDISNIKISVSDPELQRKCNFYLSQKHWRPIQQIQQIISTLSQFSDETSKEKAQLQTNFDEISQKFNQQKIEFDKNKKTLAFVKEQWRKIQSAEDNLGNKAYIRYNDIYIKTLGQIIPKIGDYTDASIEMMFHSEYGDIIEALLNSNHHLQNQLRAANLALEEKDEFEALTSSIGASTPQDIAPIIEKMKKELEESKKREELLKKDCENIASAGYQTKMQLSSVSNSITNVQDQIEMMRIKIIDLEHQIQLKDNELQLKDTEHMNALYLLRRELETERQILLQQKEEEIENLTTKIEKINKKLAAAEEESSQYNQNTVQNLNQKVEILQDKIKELSSDLIEQSMVYRERIKNNKRKYKSQISELINTNIQQREVFEAAIKKMERKSEQESQLTEKLTKALQEYDMKYRELIAQYQEYQNE